jgi:hypothetical protein
LEVVYRFHSGVFITPAFDVNASTNTQIRTFQPEKKDLPTLFFILGGSDKGKVFL